MPLIKFPFTSATVNCKELLLKFTILSQGEFTFKANYWIPTKKKKQFRKNALCLSARI